MDGLLLNRVSRNRTGSALPERISMSWMKRSASVRVIARNFSATPGRPMRCARLANRLSMRAAQDWNLVPAPPPSACICSAMSASASSTASACQLFTGIEPFLAWPSPDAFQRCAYWRTSGSVRKLSIVRVYASCSTDLLRPR